MIMKNAIGVAVFEKYDTLEKYAMSKGCSPDNIPASYKAHQNIKLWVYYRLERPEGYRRQVLICSLSGPDKPIPVNGELYDVRWHELVKFLAIFGYKPVSNARIRN